MFVSPLFLNALSSELASGRYPLRAGARLPCAFEENMHGWVPSDRVDRFVAEAIGVLDNRAGGLLLGERAPYTMLHVLGHLLLECSSLREVFNVMQRYSAALFEGMSWYMVERVDDHAEVGFRLEAHSHQDTERFWSEWLLGVLVRIATELFDVQPVELSCAHAAPSYAQEYGRSFQCPVRFGQPMYALRFPRELLKREPTPRDAALFCLLRDGAEKLLRARASQRGFTERVRDTLSRQPGLGDVDLHMVARQLGTTPRMLRRRLQQEGQTVSNVVNNLRCELAKRALVEGDESLKEIADRLGYSEPSAFHRAFRRWTGFTPGRFREQQWRSHPAGGPACSTSGWSTRIPVEPSGPNNIAPMLARG
ncbi:MAG: AraC family transcriptional regulator ligand-binding domain-containing protein [Myxococcales bacterium]